MVVGSLVDIWKLNFVGRASGYPWKANFCGVKCKHHGKIIIKISCLSENYNRNEAEVLVTLLIKVIEFAHS